MKEIFINGRFLSQSITGVQRYAIELIKEIDNLIDCNILDLKRYSFVLLGPQNIKIKLKLKHISLKCVGHLKGHLWEQIELPFYARRGLLISLCNAAPLFKNTQIVTIHDAAVFGYPSTFSLSFRTWYKILLKLLGIVSKQIITDSYFSKTELIKYCKINQNKLKVIYLGKEHLTQFKPDNNILYKYHLTEKPFVLAVSSMNPNKNFYSIVRAIEFIEEMDFNIVIVGGTNPKVFSKTNVPLSNYVKYVGYISDSELRALYEKAVCFIYPSFYEGFGLPPLEAMACGCPVIVSTAASLPEVCGDAALYCDPYSPKDIADKILCIMNDVNLRETLRQKGLKRAKQFTWQKCALETATVLEELLLK